MENPKPMFIEFISRLAVAGNVLFVIWIMYNGIHENFEGTFVEQMSYIALLGLLAVNAFLLWYQGKK